MEQGQDWTPGRVADRLAIQEILHRHCRALDRLQLDGLAALYHPDAVIERSGVGSSVREFVADVGRRHAGVPHASHMVTNMLVDFLGPDRAFVESWCLALEQHPGAARTVDHIHRVRYGDVFERRDGTWRIARRMFVTDHVMGVVADPALAPSMAGRTRGRRDADDPIARARAALGLAG
ncbi:MAG: nuclear transport factor 2 family protein [Reyranellaceae bacterium]